MPKPIRGKDKKFWEIRNVAADNSSAELLLYGDIAEVESWWFDTITPKQFNRDLARLGNVKNINVRLHSYGGDVFAAHAIYNSLVQHSAAINVRVDGIAASAATIIMAAGDHIVMPENAVIMIHNPWTYAVGDESEMAKAAEMLSQVKESILNVYESRTGMSREELSEMMDSETWITADEAVSMGFADEVDVNEKVAVTFASGKFSVNGMDMDLSRMKMVPVALLRSAVESTSTPAGVEDTTASAEADQNNQEDVTMSVTQKAAADAAAAAATPAAEPAPAADAALSPAEIAAAERKRIVAIQDLAIPGAEEIIQAAIENGDTPEATALAIMKSGALQSANAMAARQADAKAAGGVSPNPQDGGDSEREATVERMAQAGNKHLSFVRGGGVK